MVSAGKRKRAPRAKRIFSGSCDNNSGETWADQRYSFARRDLVYLVKYATAKVECAVGILNQIASAEIGPEGIQTLMEELGLDMEESRRLLLLHGSVRNYL